MMKQLITLAGLVGAGALLLRRPAPVDLRGKVVVITGASAGIGRASAHAFAAQGARVVLVARREALLHAVCDELAQYGVEVLVCPADVTDDAQTQTVADAALRAFGRIDVLVNNAGLSMGGPFVEHDPAAMRRLIEVNYYGAVRMAQVVLPVMLAQRSGQIINVASIAGLLLSPGQTVYAGVKAGLIGFSDALRGEVEHQGVRVSLVLPGWTYSQMTSNLNDSEMRAAWVINPFTGGYNAPEEVSAGIVSAVRGSRLRVIFGTPLMRFTYVMTAYLSPWLQHLGYRITFRLFVDKARLIAGMKELGA